MSVLDKPNSSRLCSQHGGWSVRTQ